MIVKMDKCWFVLKQRHICPPTDHEENGQVKQSGPICLGHFLSDLGSMDYMLNQSGPNPFPLDMPIYRTREALTWYRKKGINYELSNELSAPIAALAGITVEAGGGVSRKNMHEVSVHIPDVETMTINPTRSYIGRCLEEESISEHVHKRNINLKWSVFIVTGLKVIRGGFKGESTDEKEHSVMASVGLDIPLTAKEVGKVSVNPAEASIMSSESSNDFVWAVRLGKITKGLFDSKWTARTYSKGAVFDTTEKTTDIDAMMAAEGIENYEILRGERADEEDILIVL
ncbi:hypothetical protein B0I35DRAFT_59731 [Stachybotrys elegans]|uniref:Uncharacterized protein n=1 Tax=Stachybotrys elegans TaxID=80388 RepID=A0A8K0SR74_9HYPO|nr:hypothetical protein B0I35DRAFT_59731 [Stachybotrys elegans]